MWSLGSWRNMGCARSGFGEHRALRLLHRKDIPRLRKLLTRPFHVKEEGRVWALGTFEEKAEVVRPVVMECDEVSLQLSLFPQGTLP